MQDNNILGVCGGGITGLLLSYNLAKLGFKVELFTEQIKIDESSPMVHAVNAITKNLLQDAFIWHDLDKQVFHHMAVCLPFVKWEFHAQDVAMPALGYIIPLAAIKKGLYEQCQNHKNITINQGKLTQPLKLHDDFVVIKSGQKEIAVSWLFAADGSNSWVRSQLSTINCHARNNQQTAITASILLEQNLAHTTWQSFLPTGPIALLPRKEQNQAALIWSSSQGTDLMQQSDDEFCQSIEKAVNFSYRVKKLISQRVSYPLSTQCADKFYQQRCLLVGDAAHTILPLFGQGANLASLDILAIIKTIKEDSNLNNLGAKYHAMRYLDSLAFGKIAYNLDYHSNKTTQLLSNAGSMALSISQLKQLLIKYALGQRTFLSNSKDMFNWPNY